MLTKREREIVAAVAEALLPIFPALGPETRGRVACDVAGFLAQQIASMPVVLRVPYRLTLVAFDVAALVRRGRTFRRLDEARRVAHLAWWEHRGGLPARNFVKVLRSCALFAYFDHPLVTERLVTAGRAGEAA